MQKNVVNDLGKPRVFFGRYDVLCFGTIDKITGLVEQRAMFLKKLSCSSFEVSGIFNFEDVTEEGKEAHGTTCFSTSLLCFVLADEKSILETGMYGTSFTYAGISYTPFSPVHVTESLIRTAVSTANKTAPTCEHASHMPAMQLQCAKSIVPLFSARIHALRGVSRARCE